MSEELKEKIEEITTINFSITKCPMKVYKKFCGFCNEETNNNYSFGLKLLLDGMEGNIKESLLFEQYIELKARMQDIENKMAETKQEPEKKAYPKTMGSGNKIMGSDSLIK